MPTWSDAVLAEGQTLNLTDRRPIFIGYKMDGQLRRRMESLTASERAYASPDGSAFLRICRFGDDTYVGKVVEDRLSTDRVDDVRRNVLSILQRLSPDTRFPAQLDILVCEPDAEPPTPGE